MNEITTTDFSRFGWRERKMAAELLTASCENGFPEDFEDDEVQIMMNMNSGNVFFTNSEFQVAMMNGDTLESFYTTPYSGHEGFADDLKDEFKRDGDSWNSEDVEYLHDLGILSDDEWEEYSNKSPTMINDIYGLRNAYYAKHPSGHYFDHDTLKFFGESLSSMRLLKGTVKVKDMCGKEHEAYVISRLQKKYPGGARRTYAWFDVETLDDIYV